MNRNDTLLNGTKKNKICQASLSNKYGKKLQETATKAGIDAPKTASKK